MAPAERSSWSSGELRRGDGGVQRRVAVLVRRVDRRAAVEEQPDGRQQLTRGRELGAERAHFARRSEAGGYSKSTAFASPELLLRENARFSAAPRAPAAQHRIAAPSRCCGR